MVEWVDAPWSFEGKNYMITVPSEFLSETRRHAAARALEEAADEIFANPTGWRPGSERAAFHAGADAVCAGLYARAAKIREGKSE